MDMTRLPYLTHFTLVHDNTQLLEFLLTTQLWPLLTHLFISDLFDMNDDQLMPWIESHPRLQYLSLQQSSSLTDATLEAMAHHLPALIYLKLPACKGMTVDGLRRLVLHCPQLKLIEMDDACFTTTTMAELVSMDIDEQPHV